MKKNPKLGQKVEVYAAFPEMGAYFSGATGHVESLNWPGDEPSDPVVDFVSVRMEGSGDIIPVHRKQLRKVK